MHGTSSSINAICLTLSIADGDGKSPILPSSKTKFGALIVEVVNAQIEL
jgi:hypothetical protein